MLPTKLLEYISMGIPCVAPRTETISRYFDDQMIAFFDAESVDSLARTIVDLYLNPERRACMAREATERFARIYSWRAHKSVYTSLVAMHLARWECSCGSASSSERDERPMPK
jgi:glycosyltransferase involved in cell wall biosynthesis